MTEMANIPGTPEWIKKNEGKKTTNPGSVKSEEKTKEDKE